MNTKLELSLSMENYSTKGKVKVKLDFIAIIIFYG